MGRQTQLCFWLHVLRYSEVSVVSETAVSSSLSTQEGVIKRAMQLLFLGFYTKGFTEFHVGLYRCITCSLSAYLGVFHTAVVSHGSQLMC
jgi:hypothetical protein